MSQPTLDVDTYGTCVYYSMEIGQVAPCVPKPQAPASFIVFLDVTHTAAVVVRLQFGDHFGFGKR